MMINKDVGRLEDIVNCITKIEQYLPSSEKIFFENELIQNLFVRQIQIIGEAARALSEEFRSKHPQVPWKDIIGMRHFIVHQYTDIKLETVWEVVTKDLPKLKSQIQILID